MLLTGRKNSHLSSTKRCCGVLSAAEVTQSRSLGWTSQPHPLWHSLKQEVLWVFLYPFPPTSFLVTVCYFLNLNVSFLSSPLSLAEILLFCFTNSIKIFPRFPPHNSLWSLLHLEPHALLYFLWHLPHSTSCCGCLILLKRLWTSWRQVQYFEKVLIKYLLDWVPDFLLSAGFSTNAMIRTFFLFLSNLFALLTSFFGSGYCSFSDLSCI